MTPSQLYKQENDNGKLKAEIKELLSSKALSRYEAEELIQLNVLSETDRARKINQSEIRRLKENHNMTTTEKLDIISHLYTLNGYEIVERGALGIKLFKKKKFSYLSAFLWFLLLGVGLVIYILYYLLRGDHRETIIVENNYKEKPVSLEEETLEELNSDEEIIEDESLVSEDIQEENDEHSEELLTQENEKEEVEQLNENETTEEQEYLEEVKIEDSKEEISEETGNQSDSDEKTEEEKLLEELNHEDDLEELKKENEPLLEVKEKTEEEKLLEELADSSDLAEEKTQEREKTEEEKLLEELSK